MSITEITLLINLGTPDAPTPKAVGHYLDEFLTDPDVISIPSPIRELIVKTWIVPRRKYESARAYQKIWSERGSPLLFHTADLSHELNTLISKKEPHHRVEFAMRYGNPSIISQLKKIVESYPKIQKLNIAPLYPQAAAASTETALKAVKKGLKTLSKSLPIIRSVQVRVLKAFYNAPEFIECFANRGWEVLNQGPWDHVIFSFHGLPESAIRKKDPSGSYCLKKENCSIEINENNHFCYRAQCFSTAQSIAKSLGIPREKFSIGFQSRLGPTRWIRPYLDDLYQSLPQAGHKRVVIFSPSFVADCLETLEELMVRGKEQFLKSGGEELRVVPSLNSGKDWVYGLSKILERNESFDELP